MRLDELIKWAWDNPGLATGRNFIHKPRVILIISASLFMTEEIVS